MGGVFTQAGPEADMALAQRLWADMLMSGANASFRDPVEAQLGRGKNGQYCFACDPLCAQASASTSAYLAWAAL
jgi:hypothetical protein